MIRFKIEYLSLTVYTKTGHRDVSNLQIKNKTKPNVHEIRTRLRVTKQKYVYEFVITKQRAYSTKQEHVHNSLQGHSQITQGRNHSN